MRGMPVRVVPYGVLGTQLLSVGGVVEVAKVRFRRWVTLRTSHPKKYHFLSSASKAELRKLYFLG